MKFANKLIEISYKVNLYYSAQIYPLSFEDQKLPVFDSYQNAITVSHKVDSSRREGTRCIYNIPEYGDYIVYFRLQEKAKLARFIATTPTGDQILSTSQNADSNVWFTFLGPPINRLALGKSYLLIEYDSLPKQTEIDPPIEIAFLLCNEKTKQKTQEAAFLGGIVQSKL